MDNKNFIQKIKDKIKVNKKTVLIFGTIVILILASLGYWWWHNSSIVYIEKAQLSAPVSIVVTKNGGLLEEVFVHTGDILSANTVVARVGNELIKTENGGLVIEIKNDLGSTVKAGETIAKTVDQNEFRIIGRLDEDKGLKKIQVGQIASFKFDAYGRQKFYGVVDEISQVSEEGNVVFSISDKKESKVFEVKVRFNPDNLPELRQGLSAEIWIETKP